MVTVRFRPMIAPATLVSTISLAGVPGSTFVSIDPHYLVSESAARELFVAVFIDGDLDTATEHVHIDAAVHTDRGDSEPTWRWQPEMPAAQTSITCERPDTWRQRPRISPSRRRPTAPRCHLVCRWLRARHTRMVTSSRTPPECGLLRRRHPPGRECSRDREVT
jgi:hypothetical protein